MRKLNDKFLHDLKSGVLKPILQSVKTDDTLCLEIRENYINIYYRGGSMFLIESNGADYKLKFDFNYCNHRTKSSQYVDILKKNNTILQWVFSIPYIKAEMDLYFYEHPKLEREYQQVILRDNNCSSVANATDYYIADIEYANSENGSRFDLLGVRWPSTSTNRKNSNCPTLAIMELKYGDGAFDGSAGIIKHFKDIKEFVNDNKKMTNLFDEVETMFNQKVQLGLTNNITKTIVVDRSNVEYILLLANHKPSKSVLLRELKEATLKYYDILNDISVKVATANYLGYGLYQDGMRDIQEFIRALEGENNVEEN